MLVGIDHLARVNDAFGFDVADAVILEVAKRIRARLRGGDVLGRFSGNKFGLILKNCTVDDMNDRRRALSRRHPRRGGADQIRPGLGDRLDRRASACRAMPATPTRPSTAPRRRWTPPSAAAPARSRLWRPNVERDAQRRVNIRVTDEIVTALNERRIVAAFEPVVRGRPRERAFHECLVRMEQGDGQVLLAPDIVPVAERLGLIRLVDHRVLELVVAELAAAPDMQPQPQHLAGYDHGSGLVDLASSR